MMFLDVGFSQFDVIFEAHQNEDSLYANPFEGCTK